MRNSSVSHRDWSRRYPPLMGGLVAVVMAAFVMPSALNVPQTNPSQTVEFAPVPPTDDDSPPDSGNAASLGLGSSSGVSGDGLGGAGDGIPPAPLPGGAGTIPRQKRCVGNPPRQTEDPMSPPCVAYFDGDNGGATYQGVTRDEVRVLIYLDGTFTTPSATSDTNENPNNGKCFDLRTPAAEGETITPEHMRKFQRYFNERYQTYKRFVRFIVCFASTTSENPATPESRRADAAANYAKWKPFAVIQSQIRYGYDDIYAEAMAQKGVLNFGSGAGSRPAQFYRRYPGLIWSYLPSIEEQARLYSSYVCEKVVRQPVVDSGHAEMQGKPRKLGLLRTTDRAQPGLLLFADLVKQAVTRCGGRFVAEGTFPMSGYISQSRGPDPAAGYASQNMATFQQRGVTTVIWAGGYETDHARAAERLRYYPEFILSGDGLHDGTNGASYQSAEVWRHAWVVTQQVLVSEGNDPCRAALVEADPNTAERDSNRVCSFPYYQDLRQLFIGIQVAGPRLTLGTIDQGFHAIPAIASTDPRVAGCFYNPNDYTCIKDGTAEYWDPDTPPPGTNVPGCWRAVDGGRRYAAGHWDAGNINARARPNDPCNTRSATPAAA